MSNSQDIPCRRVYVIRPKEVLQSTIEKLQDEELLNDINMPHVVMTDELPFEEYLESWRAKILEICKVSFLKEILIEYPIMKEEVAIDFFGTNVPSVELFDLWWLAEEAEYTEIPTTWKD